MNAQRPLTGAERVAKRRAALRAQGLRPKTFWLPDRDSEAFRARAKKDVEAINAYRAESDTMAFVEAIQYSPDDDYDWGPEGPP